MSIEYLLLDFVLIVSITELFFCVIFNCSTVLVFNGMMLSFKCISVKFAANIEELFLKEDTVWGNIGIALVLFLIVAKLIQIFCGCLIRSSESVLIGIPILFNVRIS